jgi:hypothetical protein
MHLAVASLVFIEPLITAGCTNTFTTPSGPVQPDVNRITLDEINASAGANAYEVIERLRPRFLTTRIDLQPRAERQVYLNGLRLGGLNQLRTIPATSVMEIRFVRSFEGGGAAGRDAGGAIVVVARTGH